MPLDKWQKVARHQPDRRVSLLAGGRPRHAEAPVRAHHQHRVDRRAARVGARAALRAATRRRKAGLMGLTRELAASGAARASASTRSRPGFFHSRLADAAIAMAEPAIKATSPIPRVGARRRAQGRRRLSRRRRLQLHHRPGHRRRRRTARSAADVTSGAARLTESPYAARPWLKHYDYWVRPHMTYPGRPLHEILATTAVEMPDAPATAFLGAS